METKDIILELRTKRGLSQDDLAEKVMVTRQAVSRWENGETVANTDTLKLLSKEFNVKFLDDEKTYLGNQLECEFGGDRCFGVLADMDFILISTYEAEGTNPELVMYKKR